MTEQDSNLYLLAPVLLTSFDEQVDIRRHQLESLFSRTSPSNSFQGKQVKWQVFLSSGPSCLPQCAHTVGLIHSWLFTMEYINKWGKPLRGILMPKWSNLSSEIIVWNCLCQLPSFCSVLQGPVCDGRTNSLQLNSYPLGAALVTVWPVACLSSGHRQRLGEVHYSPSRAPREFSVAHYLLGTLSACYIC